MHKIFAKTLFIAKKVDYLPECPSTNAFASEKVRSGSVIEGSVFITDRQTAGKGQRGNTWESEAGKNLTFSVVLKPHFLQASKQFSLQYVTSLALVDTLRAFSIDARIKWPNDIYVGSRKICGILIENTLRGSAVEYSVIGIGLNVNQIGFETGRPTSVLLESGHHYTREEVLSTLATALEKNYLLLKSGKTKHLANHYHNLLFWRGELHEFRDQAGVFSGKIVGVDPDGWLSIEDMEGSLRSYNFKEIEYLID